MDVVMLVGHGGPAKDCPRPLVRQLKMLEIRANAEERLGDKFDVKAFHTEVLRDGAMPLSMLEAKIDRWIASQG